MEFRSVPSIVVAHLSKDLTVAIDPQDTLWISKTIRVPGTPSPFSRHARDDHRSPANGTSPMAQLFWRGIFGKIDRKVQQSSSWSKGDAETLPSGSAYRCGYMARIDCAGKYGTTVETLAMARGNRQQVLTTYFA
jgi:hypothetical protein